MRRRSVLALLLLILFSSLNVSDADATTRKRRAPYDYQGLFEIPVYNCDGTSECGHRWEPDKDAGRVAGAAWVNIPADGGPLPEDGSGSVLNELNVGIWTDVPRGARSVLVTFTFDVEKAVVTIAGADYPDANAFAYLRLSSRWLGDWSFSDSKEFPLASTASKETSALGRHTADVAFPLPDNADSARLGADVQLVTNARVARAERDLLDPVPGRSALAEASVRIVEIRVSFSR